VLEQTQQRMQPLYNQKSSVHEVAYVAFDINSYLQGYKDAVRDFASQGIEMTAAQAMTLVNQDVAEESPKPKRRARGNKSNDKKMSKALAQANKELRKVNGDLRKGVTQSDIMTRAHRIKKTL